jgi:3-phenylpropionate/trans-cinnamate dioxygenase ferredoxin reductase subunit
MAGGTVIVGGGQGGFQAAASLREAGYGERIVIVGEEPALPYQRPPLSKAYLLGDTTAERLQFRPGSFYEKHAIEVVTGTRVAAIERAASRVTLASGTPLDYDHLVLATGARNRKLPVEGADLDGVMYLRTLAEADAIKAHFAAATNIVVAGAGFIGLELAAVASKLGKSVHVIEPLGRVMSRAVTPAVSQFFSEAHAAFGVNLLLNTRLQSIQGANGRVTNVTLGDGRSLPADLVLVGIGIEPAADLAQACGLPVANGIAVDARLLTADPKISAIGDCASFPCNDGMLRLESVQNAVDQGRCVAKRIAGQPADYHAVPWFWSDQRDLKLQMVGLTAGCDRTVVRGDPAARAFSVFCFRGGTLLGIESVNRAADHMFGRRLLAAGETVTPEEAGDPAFDLKARLARIAPDKAAG